ncbi:signal peptide-containing protein [Cryptosporidium ryanae]|uniref:signal peptide-containing protein n=1 Tax=Cryptosporidium ryanae TaxID=515981 RepID=UPI00351A6766|nr:signal peptide-containing protein [Cryptosporidium ryanae]
MAESNGNESYNEGGFYEYETENKNINIKENSISKNPEQQTQIQELQFPQDQVDKGGEVMEPGTEDEKQTLGPIKQALYDGVKLKYIYRQSEDLKIKPTSQTGVKIHRFGEPAPLIREEEIMLYENPTTESLLLAPNPLMKPEIQFQTIRRICNSHYKGLPKAHQVERPHVNWCKMISVNDPEVMIKVNTFHKLIQLDLISILGGIGEGGSSSIHGISGLKSGSGWNQQNICEGFFLLRTYRGVGDCERVFIDLLGRFHGQWSLFFKLFRQKFRDICENVGFSKGLWDVNNDRAYSQYTVLKSSKKPLKLEATKYKKEFINSLRTRPGICSLLNQTQKERAQALKAAVDSIVQIRYVTQRLCLADYCDIILGKQTVIECAEALTTFFKIKSETYFDTTERYKPIKHLLIKACSEALFEEKD